MNDRGESLGAGTSLADEAHRQSIIDYANALDRIAKHDNIVIREGRGQKNQDAGYVTNCLLICRGDDSGTMFARNSRGELTPRLDRYVILPIENFQKLEEQANSSFMG